MLSDWRDGFVENCEVGEITATPEGRGGKIEIEPNNTQLLYYNDFFEIVKEVIEELKKMDSEARAKHGKAVEKIGFILDNFETIMVAENL